ncbi:histone deacetylase [Cladophialophora chaetospira]|uniref:Histone deacetylase n=1 Tax=Cladophialophora chaetospira TaxID=386627 RepID=A0AA38XAU1_9EURO|nr:histone deacetylase [Cladophialophora chaetospira]
MDPDIAVPSVENGHRRAENKTPPAFASPSIKVNHYDRTHGHPSPTAAQVPLPPSSPMRSPYQTPAQSKTKSLSPRPPSRSPSVASFRGEGQSTPPLRRSTSSLSNTRGNTPQFRRTSSNLNPFSPNGKMSTPERPPVTANSVAKEYFGKELEAHPSIQTPVVVIVHDSCYGHRFSRPRATKSALATIVERPERIHATVLGASAAYVRLGGRHAEGEYAPRPKHDASKVRNIPFQIHKTARIIPLTHPAVSFVHGSKWMEELQIMCDTAEGKLALNGKELVRPIGYGKDEHGQPLPKLHEGDLYLCAESLAAFQGCLGGVCEAVDTVFSSSLTKRAFVNIRPPGHHCSADFPSGFCWLNNVHVGIAYAAMNHGLTHAAIIDFDLHHGDGSQNIAWDQNRKAHSAAKNASAHKKTPIGYYSLHDINSYPCEWGDEEKVQKASLCIENAHGQSIWNVHLEPWATQQDFWKLYEKKYLVLLEKTRVFLRQHTARLHSAGQQSKAAIFISAGFDASEHEGAGMQRHSVNVPTDFYAQFTADIARLAQEDDLGVDGRVISVLEGGYSDRALTSGVLSHICGLTSDTVKPTSENPSLTSENRYQTINNWVDQVNGNTSGPSYSAEWWATQNLEELEAAVAGRQPGPKGYKDKTGDYASPTQASTLKMTDHARERHSLSSLQARMSLEARYEPPPPEVDWAIAAYELSRVIIPSDRQTLSCTHDELNAEATKSRQKRQSAVGVAAPSDVPMQLRVRKAKAQPPANPAVRAVSRTSSRRTTIAAVSDLPDPSMKQPELPYGRMRRRSSDASSILSSFQGMKLSDDKAGDTVLGSKPTNSQVSSRAPSVVPEQGGKAVPVKKTRVPAAPKAPPKPKASPRKPKANLPPVPALPSKVTQNGVKRESSLSSQDGTKVGSKTDDLENVTNGMKKISIKLKVPSAEESAASQHQKVLDDKLKKPRAPRKPAVPKAAKIPESAPVPAPVTKTADSVPIQPKPVQADSQQPVEAPTTTVVPEPANGSAPANGFAIFHPASEAIPKKQEMEMPPPPYTVAQPLTGTEVPAISGAPITTAVNDPKAPGPETLANIPQPPANPFPSQAQAPLPNPVAPATQNWPAQEPIKQPSVFDAPNPYSYRATTPVQRTKQDLPVFTSSSPIPFAKNEASTDHITSGQKEESGDAKLYDGI